MPLSSVKSIYRYKPESRKLWLLLLFFSVVFEELEAFDETSDNSFTIGDVIRSTKIEDQIMDHDGIESKQEASRADKIKRDVSLLNEEVSDTNHFLGINFGMDKKFFYRHTNSVLKHHSWACMKWKEIQGILKLFARKIYGKSI